jgi:hypothetical protein
VKDCLEGSRSGETFALPVGFLAVFNARFTDPPQWS